MFACPHALFSLVSVTLIINLFNLLIKLFREQIENSSTESLQQISAIYLI